MQRLEVRLTKPQTKVHRWTRGLGARKNRISLPWGRGTGKALALDTPIPTPTGWTTMGSIKIGDEVLDEHGRPCRVVNATDVMHDRTCFEVRFDDGARIIADAEHQWFTWDKRARKSHGRAGPGRRPSAHPQVRTTAELAATVRTIDGRETNHTIAVAGSFDTQDVTFAVHPYALGAWLGDGTTKCGQITIGEQDHDEMVAHLRAVGCRLGKRCLKAGTMNSTYSMGIQPELRALGVLGNKHIPPRYLRASLSQRRELLAGLLDTDGSCDKRGGLVEFCSMSERLARDTLELARSLGHKATIRIGRAMLNGIDHGTKFRVCFTPRESVFGLTRKNANIRAGRAQLTRTTHRAIVAVRRIASVPVRCIAVDSPSHLFLASESFIPTHNSRFLRWRGWEFVATHDGKKLFPNSPDTGIRIVLLMPTLKQFRKVHGDAIDKELRTTWKFLGGKFNHTDYRIRFPGGSWIQILSAEQGTAIAGTRCDVVLIDECDDVDIALFDALCAPWLSEPWSLQMVLFGGTPRRGRNGLLYRQHRWGLARRPHMFSLHATYLDSPEIVDLSQVELDRSIMSPAIFKREYLSDFDAAEGLVYSQFAPDFHVRVPDPATRWTEVIAGVDHGWNHPGAFTFIGIAGDGYDAVAHLLHEVHKSQRDEPWWCDQAKDILESAPERWGVEPESITWYPDPSSPSRIRALKNAGCKIGETNNAVEDGVNFVSAMLAPRETSDEPPVKYARLYVDPSCENVIKEFGLYRRKRSKHIIDPATGVGAVLDEIEDGNDDGLDSLRYALHSRLGKGRSTRTDTGPEDYDFG